MSQVTITKYATTYEVELYFHEMRDVHGHGEELRRHMMLLVGKKFEDAGATLADLKNPGCVLTQLPSMSGSFVTFTLEVSRAHA